MNRFLRNEVADQRSQKLHDILCPHIRNCLLPLLFLWFVVQDCDHHRADHGIAGNPDPVGCGGFLFLSPWNAALGWNIIQDTSSPGRREGFSSVSGRLGEVILWMFLFEGKPLNRLPEKHSTP